MMEETFFPLLNYQVKKPAKTPIVSVVKYNEFDNYLETVIQCGVSLCILVTGPHVIIFKLFSLSSSHSTSHCLPLLSLWDH